MKIYFNSLPRRPRILPLVLAVFLTVPALSGCAHKHTPGPEATCTEPQCCTECGEILAEALGHTPGADATCTEPQCCTVCGAVLTEVLGHTPGADATCTEPQRCEVCGAVLTEALGHTPLQTACTEPICCEICGEVLAEAPGHVPGEATCTGGVYCTVCGELLEKAAGHSVNSDTGICEVCGAQVTEPGMRYIAPGAHGESGEGAESVIPETQNTGHYNAYGSSRYAGNVLICGDYALEYFHMDSTGSSNYASIVNDFARKYPELNVTCLLIPKCAAYESPSDREDPHDSIISFISSTYAMMDESINKADCAALFDAHAGEYLFYRTDHHWTSLGAYYASRAYCEANGIVPRELESYETVIRTGVVGSLSYYSGYDSALEANPDYTVCHFPDTGYTMRYTYGGEWFNGTALNTDNKGYAYVFICGDVPLTVFETDNKNGKALIIFKESYGNAFVPYMLDYYERVVVVDIREQTDNVSTLIARYGITDALIINNVQAATGLQDTLRSKLSY